MRCVARPHCCSHIPRPFQTLSHRMLPVVCGSFEGRGRKASVVFEHGSIGYFRIQGQAPCVRHIQPVGAVSPLWPRSAASTPIFRQCHHPPQSSFRDFLEMEFVVPRLKVEIESNGTLSKLTASTMPTIVGLLAQSPPSTSRIPSTWWQQVR